MSSSRRSWPDKRQPTKTESTSSWADTAVKKVMSARKRLVFADTSATPSEDAFWRKVLKRHEGKRTVTPFQRRVHLLCSRIPAGKVTTYGTMAQALGSSARAVGQALRLNPYPPMVPCHRVIASTLYIGGFKGEWGVANATVAKKIDLLRSEGVQVQDEYVHKTHCLQDPSIITMLPLPDIADV